MLFLFVAFNSLYFAAALTLNETQATEIIKEIVRNGGDKTMAEIFREIDKAVALLDAESQIEHVKWKNGFKEEEQKRLQLFKEAIPKLPSKAQQRLIRIAMIHQNNNMTLNEKRQALYRIQDVMDPYIREKLETVIPPSILYQLIIV